MRTHAFVAVALTLAIGIAGCATSGRQAAPKRTGGSANPAASPTERHASVQQYAGVVNSTMKDMRKTWQNYQDQDCDFATTFACQMLLMSLDLEAQTLVMSLDGAVKPGVPAYIGAPPAEIGKLVADTRTAAQVVDASITDEGEAHDGMGFAISHLMSIFDRWDPYI